jgi:uncharacterized protein (DUF488 family)
LTRSLFSIGYSDFAIDEFVATLQESGVKCLIDTREIAMSRKRGFSKTVLNEKLLENGFEYRHFRCLGSPRADRHEVRETGDYNKFFSRVRRHLKTPEAIAAITTVIEIAKSMPTCLMCYCGDWTHCHRSCVLDAIGSRHHFSVEHLGKSDGDSVKRRLAA